jgi:hypothetical protein
MDRALANMRGNLGARRVTKALFQGFTPATECGKLPQIWPSLTNALKSEKSWGREVIFWRGLVLARL